MNTEPNYMGYDGFVWWMGVVEDRIDPLKLGRCRVRIAGAHTADKSIIPTNALPWAHLMLPVTDSSMLMVKEGDYVLGFYLDGANAQHPVLMGILPGIPDQLLPNNVGFTDPRTSTDLTSAPRPPASLAVSGLAGEPVAITETASASRYPTNLNEPTISRLARNDSTETIIATKKTLALKSIPIAGGGAFSEPDSPYAATYPYNRVIESESGHVIEIDDTPTKERIHIYHRSGTSIEIGPDGTYISRVNSDKYDVILSDNNIFVNGDCNLTVNKNINMKSGADLNIEVENNVNIKAGKSVNIQTGTTLSMQSQGPSILQSQDSVTVFSEGTTILQGSTSQIQPGITAPISGLLLGAAGVPIKITSVIAEHPTPPLPVDQPDMTDPGNQDLAARPGTKVDLDHPVERYTAPVETPTDLPIPTVANTASNTVSTVVATGDVMVRAMNRANIQDPTQRAMMWAQTNHESGGFKGTIESTSYRRETLLRIFPKYFTTENVDQYVGDGGVKWPSRAYGNRMGNGTEASGDGYTYRGRGFIQLTGKANYLLAAKSFKQDFVTYPDATRTPDLAADIAVWFFQKGGRGSGYRGSYGDILSVTKFVNGGDIGLTERAKLFETAKTKSEVTTYNATLI